MRVGERGVGAARRDSDGGASAEHLLPCKRASTGIELVGVCGTKAAQHTKHAARKARPQTYPQTTGGISRKGNAALKRAHLRGAQCLQLVGQSLLKAGGAAGVVLHREVHGSSVRGCVR